MSNFEKLSENEEEKLGYFLSFETECKDCPLKNKSCFSGERCAESWENWLKQHIKNEWR